MNFRKFSYTLLNAVIGLLGIIVARKWTSEMRGQRSLPETIGVIFTGSDNGVSLVVEQTAEHLFRVTTQNLQVQHQNILYSLNYHIKGTQTSIRLNHVTSKYNEMDHLIEDVDNFLIGTHLQDSK